MPVAGDWYSPIHGKGNRLLCTLRFTEGRLVYLSGQVPAWHNGGVSGAESEGAQVRALHGGVVVLDAASFSAGKTDDYAERREDVQFDGAADAEDCGEAGGKSGQWLVISGQKNPSDYWPLARTLTTDLRSVGGDATEDDDFVGGGGYGLSVGGTGCGESGHVRGETGVGVEILDRNGKRGGRAFAFHRRKLIFVQIISSVGSEAAHGGFKDKVCHPGGGRLVGAAQAPDAFADHGIFVVVTGNGVKGILDSLREGGADDGERNWKRLRSQILGTGYGESVIVRAEDGNGIVAGAAGGSMNRALGGHDDGIGLRAFAVGSGARVGERCESVAEDVGRAAGGIGTSAGRDGGIGSELIAGKRVDAVIVEVDDIVGIVSGVGWGVIGTDLDDGDLVIVLRVGASI